MVKSQEGERGRAVESESRLGAGRGAALLVCEDSLLFVDLIVYLSTNFLSPGKSTSKR